MHSEDNIQALSRPDTITRLMLRLHETCSPLTLMSGEGGSEVHVVTRSVDAGCKQLVIDGLGEEAVALMAHGRELHAKAVIDGILTWFTVPGILRGLDASECRLDFPEAVYRLQRRAALRVRPPQARAGARIATASRELSGIIQDLSATGIGLRFARTDADLFEVGSVVEHADIRCDCGLDVQVRLEVANLRETGEDIVLVGMRFIDLDPAGQAALERAMRVVQREMLGQD